MKCDQCTNNAQFECNCKFIYCSKHISKHLESSRNHIHKLICKQNILQNQMTKASQEKIKQLESLKHKIQTLSYELTLKLNQLSRKLIETINSKIFNEMQEIMTFSQLEDEDIIHIKYETIMRVVNFEELFKLIDDKNIEQSIQTGFEKIFFEFQEKFEANKKFITSYLFIQRNGQDYVNIIDINTLSKIGTSNVDFMTIGSTPVLIGDDEYFIYGGGHNKLLPNTSRIVNFKKNLFQPLKQFKPCLSAGGCLKNSQVFIFGGKGSFNESESKKFNLITQTWSKLSTLPYKSTQVTASKVNLKIFFTSWEIEGLYLYRDLDDSYEKVFSLKAERSKYIFDKWVLVRKNYLYEMVDDKSLRKICKVDDFLGDLAYYAGFQKGKFIYFVLFNGQVHRIDTERKCVELVRINWVE